MPASRVLRVGGCAVWRSDRSPGYLLISVDILSDDADAGARRAGHTAKSAFDYPLGPTGVSVAALSVAPPATTTLAQMEHLPTIVRSGIRAARNSEGHPEGQIRA
jgi:hypothetical protein